MSFVEKHRLWLLPAMAVGAGLAVWVNLPSRPSPEAAAPLAGKADLPRRPESGPADDLEDAEDRGAGEAALQALAAPPPGLHDRAALMETGRHALGALLHRPAPVPALHPGQWQHLAALPGEAPGPHPAAGAPAPDFLVETAGGREAWIHGQGFRPGSTLPGGYRVEAITPRGVTFSGPGGTVFRPLKNSLKAGTAAPAAPLPVPPPKT